MKVMTVVAFCDTPDHRDKPAVTEYTFTLNGGEPRTLDVCSACDDTVVYPFLSLLSRAAPPETVLPADSTDTESEGDGRGKPDSSGSGWDEAVQKAPCPLCDVVLANRGSLSAHLRNTHDTGIRKLKKAGRTV